MGRPRTLPTEPEARKRALRVAGAKRQHAWRQRQYAAQAAREQMARRRRPDNQDLVSP